MRCIITGAARGIGREIATGLAARGDEVTGTFRPPSLDLPKGVDWQPLDVTDPEAVAALGRAQADRPLDLLVCNAGVLTDRGAQFGAGYAPEVWEQSFAVNVTGVFLTIQAMLPALRRARQGRIAIIASNMGSQARAPGGTYAYRASKAAAINLGRNIARDLAPEGIAVGIYHPGWVRTDMGGPGADIDPATSARNLIARFDALDLAASGRFMNHDGQELAL
jgi:NAD(P)-dependent dehydrogenase (short-subunit alcohol dehydrogenase family)